MAKDQTIEEPEQTDRQPYSASFCSTSKECVAGQI